MAEENPGREVAVGSEGAGGAGVPAHPSVEAMRRRFGEAILHHEVVAGDEHVVFVEPSRSYEVLEWLRDDPDHRYDYLSDLTAVDFGSDRPIQVVYQLFSIPLRRVLRVKVELPLTALEVDSVEPLWKSANWLEREVYDMFGVTFRNHPDLRRILMPASYAEGHPLRKDFPLRGRFSRAEQTRRALSQEPEDHYISSEFLPGRDPQVVRWPEIGGKPVRLGSEDRRETHSGSGSAEARPESESAESEAEPPPTRGES